MLPAEEADLRQALLASGLKLPVESRGVRKGRLAYKEDGEMKQRNLFAAAVCVLLLGALLLIGQQASALSSSVSYGDAEGPMALAGSPVPVNVAQNRLAYCSSIENTCSLCWYAVDGNPATRWSSQFEDPQWIYVDLGGPTRIDRVILRWETAYAQAYQIQVSDNAVTWTRVYSTSDGDGGVDDLVVTGTGRYVRTVKPSITRTHLVVK